MATTLYDTLTKLGVALDDARDIETEFGAATTDVLTWIADMQSVAGMLRRGDSQPALPPTTEPWAEVYRAVVGAPDDARPSYVAGQLFENRWPAAAFALETALRACHLHARPRASTGTPARSSVPALPPEARFEPADPPVWLSQYVEYADCISPMTPTAFHESAGLWLLSTVVARRLVLRMHYGAVYPNLYVVWVAPTTTYRKSTGLGVTRRLVHRVMPYLLAANEATPEALLADLAGREPTDLTKMAPRDREVWEQGRNHAAQRGWFYDELSGLLASAGRDYNAGLLETLLRLYDCDEFYSRSTRGQGRVTIRDSYLTMMSATTPMAISSHLQDARLWGMGWWPRWAILAPEGTPAWREPREPAAGLALEVETGLRTLLSRMPQVRWPNAPQALEVCIDRDAHTLWQAYNRALSHTLLTVDTDVDGRLFGTYGRLPTSALKIAILFAALTWPRNTETPRIESGHLRAALAVTECWRASTHRALDQATATASDQLWERLLNALARYQPNGATLRDLHINNLRDKSPSDIEEALRQLAQAGEVTAYNYQPPGGGRPTRRFKLA